MELGSKEWYEKVREHYNFPMKIAFYVTRDSQTVMSMGVKSGETVNILEPIIDGDVAVLKEEVYLRTAKEYYEKFLELEDKYGKSKRRE